MKTSTKTSLFLGVLVNSELKQHLWQNADWDRHQIERQARGNALQRVRYEGSEYIGYSAEVCTMSIKKIQEFEEMVVSKIQACCPEIDSSAIEFYIFSQVLVQ